MSVDSEPSGLTLRLLDELADLPFAQRAEQLDRSSLDPQTRGEVESLLAAYDDAGGFLAESRSAAPDVEPHTVGTHIGPYELLEQLGEGGFARVYRARQSQPVRREVALKLIKLGMDTRAVIARFDQERQAVAKMEHPNIAAVYDAGATDTGRPYFVMELVKGPRITRFCDERELSIRARVSLFIDVCGAVQHAHTKGILHRDLKPSNILVTSIEGRAVPKVIDFGIAKAVQERLTDLTVVTQEQQLLGTPQYMSPEQARTGGADVDTRSDIYSLGAVLYELLAGVPPLDAPSGSGSAFEQIQKLTGADEIPRPSTRAAPERVRELRGELDWIIGKCMEKDRSRRYDSAAALAADLQAYLEHRAITAAPPTLAYQTRKFVRRNTATVVAASVILATVLAGSVISIAMAIRSTRAQRLAQSRLQEAQAANQSLAAVNSFLTDDVIGSADPAVTRGRELTVREALDNAAARLPGRFPTSPLVEATVRESVALAYWKLGHADLSLSHAQQALDERKRLLGDEHLETIRSLNLYGTVVERMGRLAEASAVFADALTRSRRVLGEDHVLTTHVLHNYGASLMSSGKRAEAEPLLKRAWEQRGRQLGDDHADTIASLALYARVVQLSGRAPEAEPLLASALAKCRARLPPDHPLTISILSYYATVLRDLGRLPEAESHQRECLELRRRVLGDDHPDTLASLANLGDILHTLGRDADAEPISRDAMDRHRRVLGDSHGDTLTTINNYAEVLRALKRPTEAEPYAREALDRYRAGFGSEHPTTLILLVNYGSLLRSLNRLDDAEACYKEALESGRRVRGDDHPDTLAAMNNYGSLLRAMKRDADAEALFAELYQRAAAAQIPPRVAAIFMMNWGPCLVRLGRDEQAEAPLLEAHRRLTDTQQVTTPRMRDVLAAMVQMYEKLNRQPDAERYRAELQAVESKLSATTRP